MNSDYNADRIIRLPEVLSRVGLGKTALYGLIKRGEFPEQIKLGRASGWSECEVQDWIDRQKNARRAA